MGVGYRVSSGKPSPYLSFMTSPPGSSPGDETAPAAAPVDAAASSSTAVPDGSNETGPPVDVAEASVPNEPSNETRPFEGPAAAAVAEVVVARRREEETKMGDEPVVSIHCFV